MKKTVALLLAALLALLPTLSLAEESIENLLDMFSVNAEDRNTASGESITLDFNGEIVNLVFDDSPMYSSIQGGTVQASYYAYGKDGVTLYELYICFPETAKPGMIITPEYGALTGEDSSVSLIVSTGTTEQLYYFSSLAEGVVYPTDSSFSIAIDSADAVAGGYAYAGRLSATLVALDMASGATIATLAIPETPFSFTLSATGQEQRFESVPLPKSEPSDLRKV